MMVDVSEMVLEFCWNGHAYLHAGKYEIHGDVWLMLDISRDLKHLLYR